MMIDVSITIRARTRNPGSARGSLVMPNAISPDRSMIGVEREGSDEGDDRQEDRGERRKWYSPRIATEQDSGADPEEARHQQEVPEETRGRRRLPGIQRISSSSTNNTRALVMNSCTGGVASLGTGGSTGSARRAMWRSRDEDVREFKERAPRATVNRSWRLPEMDRDRSPDQGVERHLLDVSARRTVGVTRGDGGPNSRRRRKYSGSGRSSVMSGPSPVNCATVVVRDPDEAVDQARASRRPSTRGES